VMGLQRAVEVRAVHLGRMTGGPVRVMGVRGSRKPVVSHNGLCLTTHYHEYV